MKKVLAKVLFIFLIVLIIGICDVSAISVMDNKSIYNPNTSDNIKMVLSLLGVSIIGMIGSIIYFRKNKK